MTSSDPRTKHIELIVTADERDAIDEFQSSNLLSSRSEALRELVRRGLASVDVKATQH